MYDREARSEKERRDGSEVKEVAERSVELELFNAGDLEEEAIPLNNTSSHKTNIDLPRLITTAAPE